MGKIAENLLRLRDEVALACRKSGRGHQEVRIVCVSKGRSIEEIKEAISCGVTDIGENRIQEALLKLNLLRAPNSELRTHFVGHLQTNKAKDAVNIFDLIHSVDSLRLAEAINKAAAALNKVQDVLVQVNVSGEESKFGIKPEDAPNTIKEIYSLPNVSVKGLMTIAPFAPDPETARPHFRALRQLRDEVNALSAMSYELRALSMGMSDDFREAVEEGATIIRIGRRIFDS